MTDNDKALAARLRNDAHMIQADGLGATLETAKQAADRIEAQAAEIKELKIWKAAEEAHHHKLRAEIEKWRNQAAKDQVYIQNVCVPEIERLREALEHIENYYGDGHRITELARAALGDAE